MAPPSPRQLAWRARIERGLRIAGPLLDLMLAAGDRLSRAVDRDELDAPAPAPLLSRDRPPRGIAGDR